MTEPLQIMLGALEESEKSIQAAIEKLEKQGSGQSASPQTEFTSEIMAKFPLLGDGMPAYPGQTVWDTHRNDGISYKIEWVSRTRAHLSTGVQSDLASLVSTPPAPSPPIGLRPRRIASDIYRAQRRDEIVAACERYANAGKACPIEWIEELRELS